MNLRRKYQSKANLIICLYPSFTLLSNLDYNFKSKFCGCVQIYTKKSFMRLTSGLGMFHLTFLYRLLEVGEGKNLSRRLEPLSPGLLPQWTLNPTGVEARLIWTAGDRHTSDEWFCSGPFISAISWATRSTNTWADAETEMLHNKAF